MIVVTAAMMQWASLHMGAGAKYTEAEANNTGSGARSGLRMPGIVEVSGAPHAGPNPAPTPRPYTEPPDLGGLASGPQARASETTVEYEPTKLPSLAPTVASATTYAEVRQSATGVEQWRELVASIFPAESVDAALRVIACESGGNANATGAAGERGLFQIHPLHRDSTYDPEGNVRAALRISGGYSWAAWTCRP